MRDFTQKQTLATSRLLPQPSLPRSRKMLHPSCSKRSSKQSGSSSSSGSSSAGDSDMPMDLCIKREKSPQPVNTNCSTLNTAINATTDSTSLPLSVNLPLAYRELYEKMTRPFQVDGETSSTAKKDAAPHHNRFGYLPSLVLPDQMLVSPAQLPPMLSSSQESVGSSYHSGSSQESPLPANLDDDASLDAFSGGKVTEV